MIIDLENVDVELYLQQRFALNRVLGFLDKAHAPIVLMQIHPPVVPPPEDIELLEGLRELNDHIYDQLVPVEVDDGEDPK